jgi:Domain of unknown function (DUF4878)
MIGRIKLKKGKLFLTLILLACVASSLSGCVGSSPSATVRSFYKAVNSGDYQKATSMFSSRIVSMVGLQKLEQSIQYQVETLKAAGGVKTINVSNERIYNNTQALVDVELVMNDGTSNQQTVQLVKENGVWKIDAGK